MVISERRYAGTTGAGESAFQVLRNRLEGTLYLPGAIGYDDARQIHDFSFNTRPAAIVRAATAEDVALAVTFAREHGLPVAVRSGGHSLAGLSMPDDALVVDLSGMKGLSIDPVARIARVQAGNTSGDLAGPASEYGLALSTGDTASVGFGGLTTGGGIGYMVRKYGLTIDNLLSAQVVTATGEIVTASAQEHPDLFWGIRGGGGNFGIITEFTFRLAPVEQILGGIIMLPANRDVVRGYLEYTYSAPDELSTLANVMPAPPLPFVPEEWVGRPVAIIFVCWAGDVEDGQRALAPLRALAEPIAEIVAPMPYAGIYAFTEDLTHRHGAALRSMFAYDLSDEAIDTMLAALEDVPSPFSLIHLRGLGGAMSRVSNDATAFAHRDKRYWLAVISVWMDPSEDGAANTAWAEAVWEQVRHEGSGVYVNFIAKEGAGRLHDAYPPATMARLAEVKQQYDPTNLFRFNQNIKPATAAS